MTVAGTYSYEVTALWDEGESAPAGPVDITLSTLQPLNAPAGWDPVQNSAYHTITVPLSAALEQGNVLQEGDWLGVFFRDEGSMTLAGMGQWNGKEPLIIHAFSDHSFTQVKDGFHEGDELIWMVNRPETSEEWVVKAIYD